ncbi:hypothetical protein [Cupriavidus necator]
MNTKRMTTAALAILVTTAVMAKDREHESGARDKSDHAGNYAAISPSRAEVIADIEISQHSGLAEINRRNAPDTFGKRYQDALARYNAMRASPEFALRVMSIARERGEPGTKAPKSSRVPGLDSNYNPSFPLMHEDLPHFALAVARTSLRPPKLR